MAAWLGLPIAILIFLATAMAVYLPATFPFQETIVSLSRSAAVLVVMSVYAGVTWQLATNFFYTDHPLAIVGVGLLAMATTAVLPGVCLFLSLWWAGIPIGSDASEIVARLRWLSAALPAIQAIVWTGAGAIGRLF
jgi:hypothetical protein